MLKKLFHSNKKYLRISIYVLIVAALLIAWEKFLTNPTVVVNNTVSFIGAVSAILQPFIIGFCIAYLLNPLMNRLQHFIGFIPYFKNHSKVARVIAILLSYIITFGAIIWLAIVFMPTLLDTVMQIAAIVTKTLPNLQLSTEGLLSSLGLSEGSFFYEFVQTSFESTIEKIEQFIPAVEQRLPGILQNVISGTISVASTSLNFIVSIFISFYMLNSKEAFASRLKKVAYAVTNQERGTRLVYNLNRINKIFQGFIVGKTIDSLIIGILCFIGMFIIYRPLALLIAVVVGVTNMIPYFGPFIGALPSVLIMLAIDPIKSIWTLIFIICLQQFDGNFLGPRILGSSTGLSALWVILSITIGGALMGPIGMFIGVPITASLKLFIDEYIDRKFDKKYKPQEDAAPLILPEETEDIPPQRSNYLDD